MPPSWLSFTTTTSPNFFFRRRNISLVGGATEARAVIASDEMFRSYGSTILYRGGVSRGIWSQAEDLSPDEVSQHEKHIGRTFGETAHVIRVQGLPEGDVQIGRASCR